MSYLDVSCYLLKFQALIFLDEVYASTVSLLSCPRALQLCRIESLRPLEYPVTAAVLRDIFCIQI